MQTNIVGVKYEDKYFPKTFNGREYSYYTNIPLQIKDIVEAPTQYGTSIAIVTSINVPEEKIESFKDIVKTITVRLDRNAFLKENVLQPAI